MVQLILNTQDVLQLIMWVIGGFSALALGLLYHIGSAGSEIKKNVSHHGERISSVETSVKSLEATGNRIEHKVDELLTKRK